MVHVYTARATEDPRNCDATKFEQALTKVKRELAKAESIAESIDATKAEGWSLVCTCVCIFCVVCIIGTTQQQHSADEAVNPTFLQNIKTSCPKLRIT